MEAPLGDWFWGVVRGYWAPEPGDRWVGYLHVEAFGRHFALEMPGSTARWFSVGERVRVKLSCWPMSVSGWLVATRSCFELKRLWGMELVDVWPPWSRRVTVDRGLYRYTILAREATSEEDFEWIVWLEQFHYASREERVAIWMCPRCRSVVEANVRPRCPRCGAEMVLLEVRGSLPSSRFLVLELLDPAPGEPRIVAYVRVDTPLPLMSRRIVVDGRVVLERMIREKVFPPDWFHPTFWPAALEARRLLLERYRELLRFYSSRAVARAMLGREVAEVALKLANTAAARIARVVVHPDYRGDGLGVLSVKLAVEWIAERRVPEMKRRKHVVETVAAMARFNPFFELAGFKYVWDTASGRPVLMYPITEEARRRLEEFLRSDPHARSHGGRLYRERYPRVDPLPSPIRLRGVWKLYETELDVDRLPGELREVLTAFGVARRSLQRYALRDATLEVKPGEVVAVTGPSGAGKTTLLKVILYAVGVGGEEWAPSGGTVEAPRGVRVAAYIPGELEPRFGGETLLEHLAGKLGDPAAAIEVTAAVGLSDVVLLRARFWELSEGQRERAKLASLLAEKPQLLVVDELASHLDYRNAVRLARKLQKFARRKGVTVIAATHRWEALRALEPSKVVVVGYGGFVTVHQPSQLPPSAA